MWAQSEPDFPTLTGRVVDAANILEAGTETELSTQLETLENESTTQIVVVTVASLNGFDIADYANKLGRTWGIGTAEDDNGVLLVVSDSDRKVRIEVGYGLEGALTDATASDIIRKHILPQFREADYDAGVQQGIDAIIQAINGEYVVTPDRPTKVIDGGPPAAAIPLFFIALIGIRSLLWKFNQRAAAEQSIAAGFVGILVTVISGYWLWGLAAGIAVFLLLLLFHRGRQYDGGSLSKRPNRGRDGPYGGSGGFGGGGGFSGGGGSFGGGGASGSW
ncbi:MAG: TPM domain-containing protein [Gammaproteobacteria bacterium]|nr:TPM domain-containing protein [Gammaproteobacteria bacterium]